MTGKIVPMGQYLSIEDAIKTVNGIRRSFNAERSIVKQDMDNVIVSAFLSGVIHGILARISKSPEELKEALQAALRNMQVPVTLLLEDEDASSR